MKLNPIWVMPIMALPACTDPAFEFRGYTDRSSCRAVIDAELADEAEFAGAFASDDPDNPGRVTELSGELFSTRVGIDIYCSSSGAFGSIHYVTDAQDPEATAEILTRFARELELLFGAPTENVAEDRRTLRYLCSDQAPIVLEERRLDDQRNQVNLSVIPQAAACLATGTE